MTKLFMHGIRLQKLEQMMMLVPNFTKRGKELIVLKGFPFREEDIVCRFYFEEVVTHSRDLSRELVMTYVD